MKKPLALIILDGFGYNPQTYGNAIASAETPTLDRLLATCREEHLSWTEDRKQRLDTFQEILRRSDERSLLLLVRCLYEKSRESAKGLSSTDAQILKKAEAMISQSFAFSLRIDKQQVGSYIRRKLGLPAEPREPARNQK